MKYLFLIFAIVTTGELARAGCNPCVCHIPKPPECSPKQVLAAEYGRYEEAREQAASYAEKNCAPQATVKAFEVVRQLHATNNWYEVYFIATEYQGSGVYAFNFLAEMFGSFELAVATDKNCNIVSVDGPRWGP